MNSNSWWIVEQQTHDEFKAILKENARTRPWCNYFLEDPPMAAGNLNSEGRLGFVPFNRCISDRYFLVQQTKYMEILVCGGISTQIYWDADINKLPAGWQGSVRQSFHDSENPDVVPNTLVALLAFTSHRFRSQGYSGQVISKMCELGKTRGYKYFIIPSLPPAQFEKDKTGYKMDEIAGLKREDGDHYDYWLRLHKKKGAEVVGTNDNSHRFVYTVDDFNEFVSSTPVEKSGKYSVSMDKDKIFGRSGKNMWININADIENDIISFNWGCIWVIYNLQNL